MRCPQCSLLILLFLCGLGTSFFGQSQMLAVHSSAFHPEKQMNSVHADSLRYKILFKGLALTNLDDILERSDEFTIFAPTDLAFSRLTNEKLNQLFEAESTKRLNYILSSHIVKGKLTASKILLAMCKGGGRAVFTTIQGNKLIATLDGLNIVLTDNRGHKTTITTADQSRENTVIHEIDSVMVSAKL